jgi:hypothetical protein
MDLFRRACKPCTGVCIYVPRQSIFAALLRFVGSDERRHPRRHPPGAGPNRGGPTGRGPEGAGSKNDCRRMHRRTLLDFGWSSGCDPLLCVSTLGSENAAREPGGAEDSADWRVTVGAAQVKPGLSRAPGQEATRFDTVPRSRVADPVAVAAGSVLRLVFCGGLRVNFFMNRCHEEGPTPP